MTIEQTFYALLTFMQELSEEESRAIREGLDEESLAIGSQPCDFGADQMLTAITEVDLDANLITPEYWGTRKLWGGS